MDLHGCKLEREHTWIYTNMSRTAPEKRKQGSRRGKSGMVGFGNRTKIQGLKNILFISEKMKKQLLKVPLTSNRRELPSGPKLLKTP